MDDLHRKLAPISKDAWQAIDDEAKKHLIVSLGGRRIVDFVGPLGWHYSAVELGEVERIDAPPEAGGLPRRIYEPTAFGRRVLSAYEHVVRHLTPEPAR